MGQIVSIQILRAIAALAIVIAHAMTDAEALGRNTGLSFIAPDWPLAAGVDLFFVISGVVMVVASRGLFGQPGAAWAFLSRRIARIVPIYWMVTTIFLVIVMVLPSVLNSQLPTLAEVVKSYLFIPYAKGADGLMQPVYKLGWTLNYEMMFYAAFALCIMLPLERAVIAMTVLFGALVVIGLVLAQQPGMLMFWTAPIILEFVAGMWIGLALLRGVRLPASAAAGVMLAALVLLIFLHPMVWTNEWLGRLIKAGIPAAIFTAGCILGFSQLKASNAPARLLVLLGDASYALYLFHPFSVRFFRLFWERTGAALHLGTWSYVAMATLAASFIAVAIYWLIEKPMTRKAQAMFGVMNTRKAVAA